VKCRSCKQPLTNPTRRPFEVWCSSDCAIAIWRAREAKKEAQELRKRREAIKPRSKWVQEAQAAVNAWIRYRDRELPCVSCGRMHQGQWHAGHYLSTGARPELRFDEANLHKQCSACNTHLSGNLVLYRAELIRRIGLAEVERLEGPSSPKKYTIQELKAVRDDYRARLKVSPAAPADSGAI
jgi:hypothetical protein